MPNFNEQLSKIAAARAEAEKAGNKLYQAKIAAAKNTGATRFAEIQQEIGTALTAQSTAQTVLLAAMKELFPGQKAYEALTGNLDGQLPILLLPVHLETRFTEPAANGNRKLLVRIYPDDIHVHTHEALMTPEEIKAGEIYWRSLVAANRLTDADKQLAQKKEAWQNLRSYCGPQRCLWVARATKPTNWKPDLAVADAKIQFPAHAETKNHSWTMAPHTQLLPDKFVVSVHGPTQRFDFEGNVIPDTVFLGPDPFYADKAYEKLGNQIVPHADVAWMHDFSKAVANGLALSIDVVPGFFTHDQLGDSIIPKISVTGLLFSADAEKGKQLLEQTIENHYYSRNGLSLVAQGTPTNNTEQDGSGYTKNEDAQPLGYYDGTDSTLAPDMDGTQMAALLGIGTDLLREVSNADMRENAEARHMNTALYPATMGYYFGRHFSPVVSPLGASQVRDFFLENVTARGPLPALRVGDQPYGLLLTSDERQWQSEDTAFQKTLWTVLNSLQQIWNQIVDSDAVSNVGSVTVDPAKLLVEVMGLQAGSVSYTQRMGANHDVLVATMGDNSATYLAAITQKEAEIKNWLAGMGVVIPPNSTANPPVNSLYLDTKIARLFDKNFVSTKPGAALQQNYITWLATVETLDELEAQVLTVDADTGAAASGSKAPNQLLFLLLRHALLLEILDQTVNVYENAGVKAKTVQANKSLFNIAPEIENKDVTQFELMKVAPQVIDNQKFTALENKPIGDILLKKDSAIPETAQVKAIRASLLELDDLPVEKLERYLSNHLDLCFYRLDAWQTGVFYQKLKKNRSAKPQGLYLGAYGWVTDLKAEFRTPVGQDILNSIPPELRPTDGQPIFALPDNAGFVHTPSLNHASAIGLLLSGYYNHKKNYQTAGDNQPFGVNLSSERVRRAKFIFEGIQNGQSLDTLLGFQFERGLHDTTTQDPAGKNLNQYIYKLRELFPVKRDNIPQQGSDKVEETVSAYPVVNGLKLLDSDALAKIEALTLDANPGDAVLAKAHFDALKAEQERLANTLDAANDLLMAETAYQVVQGNNDRTVSVLNALKNAEVPPSLEVVKTPRTTQLGFTNRASIHFRTDMSGQAGNNWTEKASPRARLETGLNRWLGQCLGNPATIVCEAAFLDKTIHLKTKGITLAELEIQPIDFVMIVGGDHKNSITELEGRIANVYRTKTATEPGDATIAISLAAGVDDPAKRSFAQVIPLARALRTLITTARPATARDFQGQRRTTNDTPAAQLHGYDVADMTNRTQAAVNELREKAFFIKGKQPNETDPASPASFEVIFESFFDDGKNPGHFDNITLSENGLRHLYRFLRDASFFGINLAYPDDVSGSTEPDLLAKAASVWKMMGQKLALAEQQLADAAAASDDYAKTDHLRKAAKTAIGEDMPVLPRFRYTNGDDMKKSLADQKQLLKHICSVENTTDELALESWLQSVVHVRPELEKLERVRMLVEAVGGKPIDIDAAQTPFRPKDSWLAVELPDVYEGNNKPFSIQEDTFALALFGETYDETTLLQSAMIVDEWTESIPTDNELTGIAYHYNQPNAAPPQSLLLAVEPTGSGHWTWESLLGVLDNTLHRAKTRAVEPNHLLQHSLLKHLLPMTLAEFDALEANVSLDYATASDTFLSNPASDASLYKPYKPQP